MTDMSLDDRGKPDLLQAPQNRPERPEPDTPAISPLARVKAGCGCRREPNRSRRWSQVLFRGFYEVVRNGAAGSQDDRPATDRLPSESTPDRVDSAVGHPARMRFWTQDDALISSPSGSRSCNTGCLYRFDTEIARPSANALSRHTSSVDARTEKSRAPAIRGRRAVQIGNPRENTQLRTKHESWMVECPAPPIRDQCLLPISIG